MKLKIEEVETLFNVVNQYINSNNTSVYRIDKQGILSRKTLYKILNKKCFSIEEKTLRKILIFPDLDKKNKEEIKKILKLGKVEKSKKTNKKNKDISNEELLKKLTSMIKKKQTVIRNENTEIMEKREYVLNALEMNKSDYLKFIDLLKELRKKVSELDMLSSFNLEVKPRSKKEILRILNKTITEIENVQKKIIDSEMILEVIENNE